MPKPREPFKYFDKGSMATVSKYNAVAQVGKLEFGGFIAWLAWLGLHLIYLVGFKTKIATLLSWAVTFLSRERGQLTITEQQAYARTRIEQLEEIAASVREDREGGAASRPSRSPCQVARQPPAASSSSRACAVERGFGITQFADAGQRRCRVRRRSPSRCPARRGAAAAACPSTSACTRARPEALALIGSADLHALAQPRPRRGSPTRSRV